MNNHPDHRPTTGQSAAPAGSGLPPSNGNPTGRPQLPFAPPAQPLAQSPGPSSIPPVLISSDMTPDEVEKYISGTRSRCSRKKPRPSLEKYRDLLTACVKGKAVMRQVFDDLIAVDAAVRAEFGPDGHRAFNACVKRMVKG